MRIILSNDEADRLLATLAGGLANPPSILAKTKVGDGGEIFVVADGKEFRGIARPEPNVPGRLRVEDMDGRAVLEAE